ncbi:MAG: ABC transporter permease [Candidatus Poribacteria bacterium]|nr:ABC transporter permease [Candidatus Poribacteria bacterium]
MKNLFLKDMRYRRARVVLTVLGITVLISLILLLGGIMNGMRIQAQQYVKSTGADIWISAEGSGGAFIGFSLLDEEHMAFLKASPGLVPDSASPLIFAQARPNVRGKPTKAMVVGYTLGKLGGPKHVVEGRMFKSRQFEDYRPEDPVPYEVIVDEKMGLEVGELISISKEKVRVVGKAKSLMFVLDTPLLFMDVRAAQKVFLENTPYVNMMIGKSNNNENPTKVAANLDAFETIEVRTLEHTLKDIMEYWVDNPMKAVQFLRVMLWLAAGLIVGMITYVTMLEKTQEIGVLKAIGASNGYVMALLLKQVALISVIGVLLGLILSCIFAVAAPIFVAINLVESIIVVCISFVVCCGSGYLAARKAIMVDPMIAFRGEIDFGITQQNQSFQSFTDAEV